MLKQQRKLRLLRRKYAGRGIDVALDAIDDL